MQLHWELSVFPHRHCDHPIPVFLSRRRLNRVLRSLEVCSCMVASWCLYTFLVPLAPILQVHRQAPLDNHPGPLDAQWHLPRRSGISKRVLAIAARRCQIVHSQTAHAPEFIQVFRHPHAAVTTHASAHCLAVIIFAASSLLLLPTDHSPWW
jgi:hypothetical protein